MLKRVLVLFVLLVVVLGLLSYTILPALVAKGIEKGLQNTLGTGEAMAVSLETRPVLKLLVGDIDKMTVEAKMVENSGLVVDSITTTVDDLQINLRDLLGRRDLNVTKSKNMGVVIRIGEANLKDYLLEGIPEYSDPAVRIEPDKVTARGYLSFSGRKFFVVVEGKFVVSDKTRVGVDVTNLTIDDTVFPTELADKLLEVMGGPDLFINASKFPMPIEVTEVRQEDGYLVIIGKATE